MIFRIISDEDEQNIRIRLSCDEYFFRKVIKEYNEKNIEKF